MKQKRVLSVQSQSTIDQIIVGFFSFCAFQADLHKTSQESGNMYALHLKNIQILLHFLWDKMAQYLSVKKFNWKSVRDRNATLCHMHPRYFKIFRYYNLELKKTPNSYAAGNLQGK